MADRRMFSRQVVEGARFLKMPATSQNLYFHLGLNADDDGIVEAYPVLNLIKANEDDLKVLAGRGFVQVLNEDLVSHITDWTLQNRIRPDRKKDSYYKDLLLKVDPSVKLVEMQERSDTKFSRLPGRSMDGPWTVQCSIGKDSAEKVSIDKCSVSAHTPSIKYRLANEFLTEEDYNTLLRTYKTETVEDVIKRILGKPYHGCLNRETIDDWCREKESDSAAQDSKDAGTGVSERLHELAKEREVAVHD